MTADADSALDPSPDPVLGGTADAGERPAALAPRGASDPRSGCAPPHRRRALLPYDIDDEALARATWSRLAEPADPAHGPRRGASHEQLHWAGLGEVVKCGFIADPVILVRLRADPADFARWESPALAELVARSVAVKASVVGEDLVETGPREILNYGHTYAHAVETATAHRWRHGEAVALGCVFAAEVAHRMGRLSSDLLALHRQAFATVGLPVTFPEGAGRFEELLEIMRSDKKVRGGAIRMVLLDDVARPVRGVVPDSAVLHGAHEAVTGAEG